MAELDFVCPTRSFTVGGKSFTVKELTVAENDDCTEAGTGPDGKWNGRLAMRLMVTKSVIEPAITVGDIAKLPLSVYNKVVEEVNKVNTGDLLPTDKEDEDPNP